MSNNKLTGVPTSFMRRTPRLARLVLDNNQLETVRLEVRLNNTLLGGNFVSLQVLGGKRCY